MELKNYFTQDEAGNILSGATCYLYVRGTESLIEELLDAKGLALDNPFVSDQQGLVQFAAPNGLYDLRVVKGSRDYRLQMQCNDVTETAAAAENAARALEDRLKEPTDPSKGSGMVAHKRTTLHIKLYRENLSVADVGAKADGSDETEFFREAVASGAKRILVPNIGGLYSLADFVLPNGVTFKGIGRKFIYEAYSEANMADSCCIKYKGSGAFFIDFKGGNNVEDINFFGGGAAVDGFGPGTGGGLNFRTVTMAKFRRGFGKAASYSGGNFWNCQAAHNIDGVSNFVDSKFFGLTVHGNAGVGVQMMTGANDNTFSDTKNEWNEGANWQFFEAQNISVLGGVTDRAGTYGVISQLSSVSFCGGIMRRSGRFMASGSAHFSLGNNRVFSINGLNTAIGVDDNGAGYNTPDYIFHGRDNGCVNTLVNGGDMSGSKVGFITGVTSALPLLSGVLGPSSKRKVDGAASSNILATTAVTKSFSFPAISKLGSYTNQSNRFIIEIRTRTPLSVMRTNRFVMEIRRPDLGGASAVFVFTEDPASTSINKTGASLNLSASNVGADGTTFDLILSNTSASDLNTAVDVFLQ